MPLDKIYRRQLVPFLALVLVLTRVRSSTLMPHPFPDLNQISLFGTILHALPPSSFSVFLALHHSISDIKVCAISPISGGNDSLRRTEKRLIFRIGTIHPHGLNERFSFIWSYPFIVSVYFCIILCICYCFSHLIGLLSVSWLSLLYKFTCLFIYFLFLSDEGQCSKR